MGEAKRRKTAGNLNTPGAILMDHVWPGNEDEVKARAVAGDRRAKGVWNTLTLVVYDIAQHTETCGECNQAITTLTDLGCCSVAQVIGDSEPVTIGIPFCRNCVTDRGKIAIMAHAAAERALGTTISRNSRIGGYA
jgi:hypothetical protein